MVKEKLEIYCETYMSTVYQDEIDGEIIVKDIFTYKQKGLSPEGNVVGEFGLYKRKPKVYDKILRKGFTKIKDIFE